MPTSSPSKPWRTLLTLNRPWNFTLINLGHTNVQSVGCTIYEVTRCGRLSLQLTHPV